MLFITSLEETSDWEKNLRLPKKETFKEMAKHEAKKRSKLKEVNYIFIKLSNKTENNKLVEVQIIALI